ncbi:hypothetical protein Ahy_A03g011692 [Arachis hypogaea]|uniref:Uncharacterized protein n=1 Tax=Arachis hypogaea TaxID=3818 RepID=A0A445DRL1_ARAHY|nr:hypothetical protein Ahy_A03g011692 [Arachis hypogaea]
MNEASLQEICLTYIERRAQISFIELYVEFEQSEADRNLVREDYNSDSEKEFESNYEVVDSDGDEDQGDGTMAPNVTDVANALANEVPFEEPYFMPSFRFRCHACSGVSGIYECSIFCSAAFAAEISIVADDEFAVGMEFSSREAVIKAMKEYTIRRSVDYRVYESEPLTFYAKCTQYGSGVSMISRKHCWVIRRYNGSHTCARATISQDHSKLDSITIAEAIKLNEAWEPPRAFHMFCINHIESNFLRKFKAPYLHPGRPRITRFLNEMDTRMLCRPRRCRQYGAEGHSRSRCRQTASANANRDAQ